MLNEIKVVFLVASAPACIVTNYHAWIMFMLLLVTVWPHVSVYTVALSSSLIMQVHLRSKELFPLIFCKFSNPSCNFTMAVV